MQSVFAKLLVGENIGRVREKIIPYWNDYPIWEQRNNTFDSKEVKDGTCIGYTSVNETYFKKQGCFNFTSSDSVQFVLQWNTKLNFFQRWRFKTGQCQGSSLQRTQRVPWKLYFSIPLACSDNSVPNGKEGGWESAGEVAFDGEDGWCGILAAAPNESPHRRWGLRRCFKVTRFSLKRNTRGPPWRGTL